MVDLRRSLFVSITREDEVSSILVTSSSLKPLEYVGEFLSFHHNVLCSVFLLAVSFT